MKYILAILISFILLTPAVAQDQWEIVELGIDSFDFLDRQRPINRLYDVQFINRDTGFIGGGCIVFGHLRVGLLFKTEDGGKTWNHTSENYIPCTSIHLVDESKGFLLGNGNTLYTVSDSGHSWIFDPILENVNDIFFINDSTVWACSDLSQDGWTDHCIFKTTNGGGDWEIVYKPAQSIYSLFFIDERSGWAVGESGLIAEFSLNGGWKTIPVETDLCLKKVFFVDRANGWISGGYLDWNSLEFQSIFMRTVDGGENRIQIQD